MQPREGYRWVSQVGLCTDGLSQAYANGNKNPNAHMTAVKVSVEGAKASDKNPLFLSNETFKPYRPALSALFAAPIQRWIAQIA